MNQKVSASVASRGHAATRIALIRSSWHHEIVARGEQAFLRTMEEAGHARGDIDTFEVPGAFEIPLHAKLLAQSGRYRAIVAVGLVVDGGIYRCEFVAHAVIDGLMRVQLDTDVPVFSAVLTPQHFHEHETHQSFFLEHFNVKGREVAQACVRTLASLESVATRFAATLASGQSANHARTRTSP
jgi:6,7-dimethyl-8-ribityllumazine synthase